MKAVIGQYVRRINTASIGYIYKIFGEGKTDEGGRTCIVEWGTHRESGVLISELVPCNNVGTLTSEHFTFDEPPTGERESEKSDLAQEGAKASSGSPSGVHGSVHISLHNLVTHRRANVAQGGPGELENWWVAKARAEIEPMVAKMAEYGGDGRAIDLYQIGRELVESGVNTPTMEDDDDYDEAWNAELGIYFYLVGKFARWKAAVQEGRKVSDDTLLDIGIYIRMAQRIREVGGWPK